MVGWIEGVWGLVTVANEVSRFVSCPFHCSSSCLPWALLGFVAGVVSSWILVGFGVLVWIFRAEIFKASVPPASRALARSRLGRYLE
jgi:hypothetical protein